VEIRAEYVYCKIPKPNITINRTDIRLLLMVAKRIMLPTKCAIITIFLCL